MNFNRVFDEATALLLQGLKMTVLVSLLSLAIGLVIGFLTLSLIHISEPTRLRRISVYVFWV